MSGVLHLSRWPLAAVALGCLVACNTYPHDRPPPEQVGSQQRLRFIGIPIDGDAVAVGGSVEFRVERLDGSEVSGVVFESDVPEALVVERQWGSGGRLRAVGSGRANIIARGRYLDAVLDWVEARAGAVTGLRACSLGPAPWDHESSCGAVSVQSGASVDFIVHAGEHLWGVPDVGASVLDPTIVEVPGSVGVREREVMRALAPGDTEVVFHDGASGSTGELRVTVREAARLEATIGPARLDLAVLSAEGEPLEGGRCTGSSADEGARALFLGGCRGQIVWDGEGPAPAEVTIDVVEEVSGLTGTFTVPLEE